MGDCHVFSIRLGIFTLIFWSPATKLLSRLDSKFNIVLSGNQKFFFSMLPSCHFCHSFCYLLLIVFFQALKLVFKFFDRLFNYEMVLKIRSSIERGTPHKFALVLGILDFRYYAHVPVLPCVRAVIIDLMIVLAIIILIIKSCTIIKITIRFNSLVIVITIINNFRIIKFPFFTTATTISTITCIIIIISSSSSSLFSSTI